MYNPSVVSQHAERVHHGSTALIHICYLMNYNTLIFFTNLCRGTANVAYTKPQQRRKKEESEMLRGDGDKTKFIDLRFERWQVVGFRKGRRRQDAP